MQQLDQFINFSGLDIFDYSPPLIYLADTVQIRRPSYIATFYVIISIILICFNVKAQITSDLIGFIYPAYKTVLAIKSRSQEDQQSWAIYWMAYTILVMSNTAAESLFRRNAIFYIARSAIFIYLYTRGTLKLKKYGIQIYQRYNQIIDLYV